eukprot:109373_1
MSERRSSARLRKRFDPRDPDHFRTPDFRGKSSSSSSQGKSIKIIDSEQTPGGTAHETRVFPNGLTLRCKSKRGRPRGRPRGSGAAQSRGASGQQKAGRSGSNLGLGRGRGASQKRSGSVGGGADKQNAKRIRSKRLQDKAEHSLQLDTNLSTEQENSDRTNVADSTRSPPPPTTSTPNGNHIDSPAMSSDSTNLVSELSSDLHLSPSRPSVRQSSAGDSVFAHPGTPARAPPSTVSMTPAAARAPSSEPSPYAIPFPVDRFPVTTDQRPKKRKKGQETGEGELPKKKKKKKKRRRDREPVPTYLPPLEVPEIHYPEGAPLEKKQEMLLHAHLDAYLVQIRGRFSQSSERMRTRALKMANTFVDHLKDEFKPCFKRARRKREKREFKRELAEREIALRHSVYDELEKKYDADIASYDEFAKKQCVPDDGKPVEEEPPISLDESTDDEMQVIEHTNAKIKEMECEAERQMFQNIRRARTLSQLVVDQQNRIKALSTKIIEEYNDIPLPHLNSPQALINGMFAPPTPDSHATVRSFGMLSPVRDHAAGSQLNHARDSGAPSRPDSSEASDQFSLHRVDLASLNFASSRTAPGVVSSGVSLLGVPSQSSGSSPNETAHNTPTV